MPWCCIPKRSLMAASTSPYQRDGVCLWAWQGQGGEGGGQGHEHTLQERRQRHHALGPVQQQPGPAGQGGEGALRGWH
jgi:hypothetical protein